jgi:hypothetical protein
MVEGGPAPVPATPLAIRGLSWRSQDVAWARARRPAWPRQYEDPGLSDRRCNQPQAAGSHSPCASAALDPSLGARFPDRTRVPEARATGLIAAYTRGTDHFFNDPWAHKFRNVLDKVRKADQPKVKRALHKIMNAAIRRKRPTAAMPCLPRDRKEIWTDLRWAVAGVSVGPEQSPGVSAGGFSFGAARSGLPVSLQLDCPSPLRNALSFVSPNFQPCARGASGDGGVSLNSRGSQSTIRPSRSYGGRSPDADGGGR